MNNNTHYVECTVCEHTNTGRKLIAEGKGVCVLVIKSEFLQFFFCLFFFPFYLSVYFKEDVYMPEGAQASEPAPLPPHTDEHEERSYAPTAESHHSQQKATAREGMHMCTYTRANTFACKKRAYAPFSCVTLKT